MVAVHSHLPPLLANAHRRARSQRAFLAYIELALMRSRVPAAAQTASFRLSPNHSSVARSLTRHTCAPLS